MTAECCCCVVVAIAVAVAFAVAIIVVAVVVVVIFVVVCTECARSTPERIPGVTALNGGQRNTQSYLATKDTNQTAVCTQRLNTGDTMKEL